MNSTNGNGLIDERRRPEISFPQKILEILHLLVDMPAAACMLSAAGWGGMGEIDVTVLAIKLGHFEATIRGRTKEANSRKRRKQKRHSRRSSRFAAPDPAVLRLFLEFSNKKENKKKRQKTKTTERECRKGPPNRPTALGILRRENQ